MNFCPLFPCPGHPTFWWPGFCRLSVPRLLSMGFGGGNLDGKRCQKLASGKKMICLGLGALYVSFWM